MLGLLEGPRLRRLAAHPARARRSIPLGHIAPLDPEIGKMQLAR